MRIPVERTFSSSLRITSVSDGLWVEDSFRGAIALRCDTVGPPTTEALIFGTVVNLDDEDLDERRGFRLYWLM